MQTNEDIVSRFFMALDALYAMGEIRHYTHFEREAGIRHSSLYKLRKDYSSRILQPHWLSLLVEKYSVSAEWLLLGRGRMFCGNAETQM